MSAVAGVQSRGTAAAPRGDGRGDEPFTFPPMGPTGQPHLELPGEPHAPAKAAGNGGVSAPHGRFSLENWPAVRSDSGAGLLSGRDRISEIARDAAAKAVKHHRNVAWSPDLHAEHSRMEMVREVVQPVQELGNVSA